MGIIGSVHSWELVTAVDGPGTRLVIFLSGCPLRCLYCHNPETRYSKWGKPTPVEDILAKIDRYERIMKTTKGGITISGGEPLMQPEFVQAITNHAKAKGLHVALDTTGYLGKFIKDELLDNIDLFLLDIKSGDEETHKKVTKRPLQPVIDFSRRLHEKKKTVWIRFVLVPGLTDAPDNINKISQLLLPIHDIIERIEVLPFHQMGESKWERAGIQYELASVKPPTVEEVDIVKTMFKENRFNVM